MPASGRLTRRFARSAAVRSAPGTRPRRGLPARFRRERVLVIGCGDVGLRAVRQFAQSAAPARPRWLALTSQAARQPLLRAAGITPVLGNLDQPASLRRVAAWATRVLYLAPPQPTGVTDQRATHFVRQWRRYRAASAAAVARRMRPGAAPVAAGLRALAYVSTTGVYGDCGGSWAPETRPVAPGSARAVRRVDAERRMRALARCGVAVAILRAPGIYAPDRALGSPAQRLRSGAPVLHAREDVYINRIHADDLARACWLAVWRVRSMRVFNVVDDAVMKLGEFFDQAADVLGLPRPPRLSLAEAEQALGANRMSFLRESRRLPNARIKRELGLQWRYPSAFAGGLHASCLQASPSSSPLQPFAAPGAPL